MQLGLPFGTLYDVYTQFCEIRTQLTCTLLGRVGPSQLSSVAKKKTTADIDVKHSIPYPASVGHLIQFPLEKYRFLKKTTF